MTIARAVADVLLLRWWAMDVLAGVAEHVPVPRSGADGVIPIAHWRLFLATERCAGPLLTRLASLGLIATLPADVQDALRDAATTEIQIVLRARSDIREIGVLAERAGIKVVVLKSGVAAASGSPWALTMSDLDVLIAPQDIERMTAILRDAGFTRPDPLLTRYHISWKPVAGRMPVEVHWSIDVDGKPLDASVWDRAVLLDGARGLWRLAWADHVCHLLTHAVVQHGGARVQVRDALLIGLAVAECDPAAHAELDEFVARHEYRDSLDAMRRLAVALHGGSAGEHVQDPFASQSTAGVVVECLAQRIDRVTHSRERRYEVPLIAMLSLILHSLVGAAPARRAGVRELLEPIRNARAAPAGARRPWLLVRGGAASAYRLARFALVSATLLPVALWVFRSANAMTRDEQRPADRRRSTRMRAAALAAALACLAGSCARPATRQASDGVSSARTTAGAPSLTVAPQTSGTKSLLQAVSPVSEQIVWASGHRGTYVRTTDGGATWSAGVVPGADTLQFRDVHAVSATTAYLLSAGNGDLSRIYKTTDGGRTWTLQFTNTDPKAFYDCFDFWDAERGVAFSDAVDARLVVLTTMDGGAHWTRVPDSALPPALPGEGGFAASGTCVIARGMGEAWIATGSGSASRVLHTSDYGRTWSAVAVPVIAAGEGAGLASIAVRDARHAAVLGGSIAQPAATPDNVALTSDAGHTWTLGARAPLPGAIYGGTWVPGASPPMLVVANPKGLAYSTDDARTWAMADTASYWAVAFASPRAGWAVGPGGRVVKLSVER